MTRYNLPAVPNQTFNIQVGGLLFYFAMRLFRDSMFIDVDLEEKPIVSGARIVNGIPVLPREVADRCNGNFFFECLGSDYPTYEMFGNGLAWLTFKKYGE